jgi:hypothetical protein
MMKEETELLHKYIFYKRKIVVFRAPLISLSSNSNALYSHHQQVGVLAVL